MDLLKEIGAILGFVAFGGLAVLTFLTFQQARHVRRLREWAGRSPERSAIEAERVAEAASEATIARAGSRAAAADEHDDIDLEPQERGPGRWDRIKGEAAYRWEELDRRSPVDAKILVGAIAAVIVGVLIITGGFGLVGGSDSTSSTTANTGGKTDSGGKGGGTDKSAEPETKVAILNGTAPEGGVGVPGVADAASKFVEAVDGYKVGAVTDAPVSVPVSVVEYAEGFDTQAQDLADALAEQLGTTEIQPMDPDVQDAAGRADLALVIGQDDSAIAGQ